MSWKPALSPVAASAPEGLAWLGLPLAFGLTLGLARWATARGLLDRAEGPLAERKLQARPVPPVGGLALFLSLGALALLLGWREPWRLELGEQLVLVSPGVLWLSLGLVLAVGLWDDLVPGGLGPLGKLSAQGMALLPLALGALGAADAMGAGGAQHVASGAEPGGLSAAGLGLLVLGLGLLALNVLNTFDNADGAAGGVACMGLLLAAWLSSGQDSPGRQLGLFAVASGFLIGNLNAPGGGNPKAGASTPSAFLGDSGAFLLALLLLFDPVARLALWVPALDLARLSVLRLWVGSRPWIGDRRHLAHRLQRCGLESRQVALVLVLLAVPACLGAAYGPWNSGAQLLGLLLGALGFWGVVWCSRKGALPQDPRF